ncbi:MAG: dipeptidase PepV [Firmicutes bacterium]|nr:dipeptidase PepV [Bacillota bacterium]
MEKLGAAVEALRGDMIRTLQQWIRIPSEKLAPEPGAPFGRPLREMLTVALSDARRLGFAARDFDGYIGDAEMGEGDETMGILVHLDVVPAGDGWASDPFGGEIRDGKVYGRGTSDDKGPAVAALFAMKAVLDAGFTPKKKVRLILGCDEESGWADIDHYKKHVAMPDFGFSPDADYPVINTEKGLLQLRLTASFGGEEGAKLPVRRLSSGERPNVIPGLATAEIGCEDFAALERALQNTGLDVTAEKLESGLARLTSLGVPGHAALPRHGKNAAGQLLLALKAIGAGGGCRAFINSLAEGVGLDPSGKGLGVDGRDALSGPLTINLGVLHVTPGSAMAVLDIRYPVLMDGEMIAKIIGMRLKDAGITVDVSQWKAPLHVPAQSEIVTRLLSVYAEVTGLSPYTIAIGGGTYARSMDNCVAFGCNFPGDDEVAHQADEYMDVEKLLKNALIFAHAIVRLAC